MLQDIMTLEHKKSIGKNKLEYLYKKFSSLPPQGSEMWLKSRSMIFGGSEIGIVVSQSNSNNNNNNNDNTENKKEKECVKLIINKVNQRFDCNPLYVWWGTVFENVAKLYLKKSYNTRIYEFGSVPCSNLPIAYSPDGLIIDNTTKDLVLLEIKCPFLRNVNDKTKIKPNYRMQIQAGMYVLPCNYTDFFQFKFRKCYESHLLDDGEYDYGFHQEWKLRNKYPLKVVFSGALWWDEDCGIREDIIVDGKKLPNKIYTSLDDPNFVVNTTMHIKTGVLMYFKCLYVSLIKVKRDKKFREKYEDIIWDRYDKLLTAYTENKKKSKKTEMEICTD